MKAVFRVPRGVLLMLSLLIVTGAVGNAADAASINEEALRRSVGQMIVVGFYGINNTDPGFHHVMEDLERGLIGGVLFLARNVQSKLDLETMVREVRQCHCSFTRSEEHTSELQSLRHLVCRLLLEKKNT